ncbi:hypothetical protein C8J56DRAFT_1166536 [Mycena floridula]|nr:hypothetical protein C8J56DRAFT_1166536 [Mycena floridula]
MPLDVLFEVFQHLEPKDLLSLIRVNKAFRDTLIAPNAISIWKEARQRYDVPEPLVGFTEAGWASFFFGGAICQICGTYGIKGPDFMILKKLCKRCLKSAIWKQGDSQEIDESILELVPYTYTCGATNNHRVKYFWRKHLIKVQEKVQTLKLAIENENPGAQAEWETYKKKRLDLLTLINKRSFSYSMSHWRYLGVIQRRRYEQREQRDRRIQDVLG